MKNLIAIIILAAGVSFVNAQALNWKNLNEDQKHIVNLNAGINYGTILGIGYGYHITSKLPVVINAEFSKPAGTDLLDDFSGKAGVQARIIEWKSFCFSAEALGIFRRYQSPYVRLLNFGSEFSGTAGYYRHSWFAAAQIGFDKAIVTQFKNSELYAESYPDFQNGWYQPATGGNFFFGISVGYSFSNFDLYLKTGKMIEQDFKTSPLIPFYAQLGVNWKIGRKKN